MRPVSFNYKAISSSQYKIVARSVDRPILPTMQQRLIEVPGRHGAYDFGSNIYGLRPIKVHIGYIGKDLNELRLKAREIAAWLNSTQFEPLTFEDEPDKYYIARIFNGVGLQNIFRVGETDITFMCQPFALYHISSGDDPTWGDELTWGMDVTWDNAAEYTFSINQNTAVDIDYIGTQEIGIESPAGSKFEIIITGSFTTLSISLNGKTINYNAPISNQTVIIDNVDGTIKADGSNALHNCSGDLIDFLKIIPGINTVSITGTGLNCSVLFDFRPQFL
jgi:predicted phage tail component-like protein